MHILKHLHLMYFGLFSFVFLCYIRIRVQMCHLGHGDTLSTYTEGEKEHKREHRLKEKNNMGAKHSTCLLFRCIRGSSRVEEITLSS